MKRIASFVCVAVLIGLYGCGKPDSKVVNNGPCLWISEFDYKGHHYISFCNGDVTTIHDPECERKDQRRR